jgi:hypothetical protein
MHSDCETYLIALITQFHEYPFDLAPASLTAKTERSIRHRIDNDNKRSSRRRKSRKYIAE